MCLRMCCVSVSTYVFAHIIAYRQNIAYVLCILLCIVYTHEGVVGGQDVF